MGSFDVIRGQLWPNRPSITLTSAKDLAFFTVDRRPGVFAGVFMLISSSSSFLATEDFRGFRAGVLVREMAAIGASFSEKRWHDSNLRGMLLLKL